MRINVYSQELLLDDPTPLPGVELIEQKADTGVLYSAVRMYLASPDALHHTPADDDRSAISFWLPKSPERRETLARMFEGLAAMVRAASPETGLD